MTLASKLDLLNETISQQAAMLGLVFVNGPGIEPWHTPPHADIGRTNGQDRGVYLFAVAEG
jgi:hypothetical protein